MNGNEMWGYIFLAMAAYTGAALLVFYKPKDPAAEVTPAAEEAEAKAPAETDRKDG